MKKNIAWMFGTLMIAAASVLSGCAGSSQIQQPPPNHISTWTWVGGSNLYGQPGVYGTQGTASPANVPGARQEFFSWTSNGNLWVFGGGGYDSSGTVGWLNDLWKFDGTNWTWVSGSNVVNQAGVYGTQGVPSPSNMPGAREGTTSWTDSNGNFWLFGGFGFDAAGFTVGRLNDLWKFDGSNWTWVGGSSVRNQAGVYGTQGTPDPANVPGAREGAATWTDHSGNAWIFGGLGYDSSGTSGWLNDLWKFDGTNWTWVSGSNVVNQPGVYGTQGIPSPANVPGGGHCFPSSWTDSAGNLWLFGGVGLDSTGTLGDLSDLWKFDGSEWTWENGANVANQAAVYGSKGVSSPSNWPGGRWQSAARNDSSGNLWLFGGLVFDSATDADHNDLWKFDGQSWTWVSGANVPSQAGVYGTQGTGSESNSPGARRSAICWIDKSGNIWVFGGLGFDSTGAIGELNDLWRFEP